MPANRHCYSCGSKGMSVFYETKGVPVQSCLLLSNQEEALRFPKRDIALGFCPRCGFIGNLIFDPGLLTYSTTYEEQQSFSPRFNSFANRLAAHLIDRYQLRNKNIVEIGCGKGDFLFLLCEKGNNSGVGIDPSYIPGRTQSSAADRVTFIQDYYSERYAHYQGDFVCCRHTLEHIQSTADFVRTVRRTIGDRPETVVFFEVPGVERILRERAFWDIYYEHCSYFSLGSLARLFRSCGFDILDLSEAFDNQYLLLEARPWNGSPGSRFGREDDLEQLARDVTCFAEHYQAKIEEWKCLVENIRQRGQRAVIWGSSSKCVAFLSSLNIQDEIDFVVDINPYRQNKYLAGSGKKIVAPEFLREYRPDTVIAMNPIYSEEIRQDLHKMSLKPELIAV